jgi:hypothetical protein
MINHLWELVFLVLIIITTYVHHYIYDVIKKKIGPWFHLFWACPYAGLIVYIYFHNLDVLPITDRLIAISCFSIERFVFYNPILNKFRNNSLFHIVYSNSKPGMWDKIYIWLGKFYPYVMIAFFIIFIGLQFSLSPS